MNNRTITDVVKDGLCTGCGTCVSMCPKNAIKLEINEAKGIYEPEIDKTKCNNCGICYDVCPGHSVNFQSLNKKIFGKPPKNYLIGNFLNVYIGHSADRNIRYKSSSSGLITQLLICAMNKGIINGALVTRMKKNKPTEPESFVARSEEEIIEAMGSKYCPVPTNIMLKEIIKSGKEEKFAVVGLPCHIHGVRKAEMLNPKLKEKIVLHFGLFCGHAPNFLGTMILLNKLKLKVNNIAKFNYRGNGWPGQMEIITKKRKEPRKVIPLWTLWNLIGSPFFYSSRCLMCIDGLAELADISFGDAWLPELKKDSLGSSLIISRSTEGEKLLLECLKDDMIKLKKTDWEKVVEAQLKMLYIKKKTSFGANKLFRRVPEYHITYNIAPNLIDYLLLIYIYLNSKIARSIIIRKLLSNLPNSLIDAYLLPYQILLSKASHKLLKNIDKHTK